MCFIALAYHHHPRYPLVIVANRDESRARATEAMHRWREAPQLIAGRDCMHGGTWLGLSEDGRFAAVTNIRCASPSADTRQRSRGLLTRNFLLTADNDRTAPVTAEYVQRTMNRAAGYAGFNLLVGERRTLYAVVHSAAGVQCHRLKPGLYTVGNKPFGTPDTRLREADRRFETELRNHTLGTEALLAMLRDGDEAGDGGETSDESGDGGKGKKPSPRIFVRGDEYGTVNSTVILVANNNTVQCVERRWDAGGNCLSHVCLQGRMG